MPAGDLSVQCGALQVLIKKGDITAEKTGAIINITGSNFDKGNGKFCIRIIAYPLDTRQYWINVVPTSKMVAQL